MLKIGNTWFNPVEVRKLTFKRFAELYTEVLKGHAGVTEAYLKCGGKIKKK